jgi:hypothetical protein
MEQMPGSVVLSETPQWARYHLLLDLIGSTPARTFQGALAQLGLVDDEWQNHGHPESADAIGAFESAMAVLKRLAATGSGPSPAA